MYLPSVVQGEGELELAGGWQHWRNNADNGERQLIYEFGYGLTPGWASELAVGTTRLPGESTHLDEIEWENIFALTEPGEYWLDLGLFAEFERDYGGQGSALKVGPMLQKEWGALQANLNLLFAKGLGAAAGDGTELDYAWQAKWRGNPRFEPGVQGFGTVGSSGELGHPTAHKLGPAFFSQAVLDGRNKIRFDAAVLFGLNGHSPGTTVRFNLEYEIY